MGTGHLRRTFSRLFNDAGYLRLIDRIERQLAKLIGFVLVVSPYYAARIQAMVQDLGFQCWTIGRAEAGSGKSRYAS